VSARPFILALFRRCQGQTDILRAVLVAIESFLVRRMVCRLSTRGYTDAFADLTPRPDGAPAEALEDDELEQILPIGSSSSDAPGVAPSQQ